MPMGDVAFARSPDTCLLGKRTAELPKLKVPEETKEILERRAKAAGMTLTEYMTWNALIHAHGIDEVEKLQVERLRVVAGMGDESGEPKKIYPQNQ